MKKVEIKPNNVSIDRIEEKCLNCGMCKKTCEKINGLEGDCINCGQCILTCPSGALIPKFDYKKILNYINDTDYTVVAFTAPAVRVAIGDEFGFESGAFLEGKMVSALKNIGFDYVFDTTFGADLTIMEEANELVDRLKHKQKPLFTSCCPSWVLYMEKYHPEDLNLVSTCKSPISMEASMIKSYFSEMYDIPKEKIITVSIAPCTSKKNERVIHPETDVSITTRELAMMIRETNIDFKNLKDAEFDSLMGSSSSSGLIFGTSGGVTEAILRTAYYMINGKMAPPKFYDLEEIRGEENIKPTTVDLGKYYLKVAAVNTIKIASENYEKLKTFDFVEVMACPGGCIGGAGQPLSAIKDMNEIRNKRRESMYNMDKVAQNREAYKNPKVQDAYISYLSKNDIDLHTEYYAKKSIKS